MSNKYGSILSNYIFLANLVVFYALSSYFESKGIEIANHAVCSIEKGSIRVNRRSPVLIALALGY